MARVPPGRSALPLRAAPSHQSALQFPQALHIRAPGCRSLIRTAGEALLLIDNELPAELRRLPRWKFARALIEEVLRTRRRRDLTAALRQLRQALANEDWLAEIGPSGSSPPT